MKKLISYCKDSGEKLFGELLLSYESVEMDVVWYYLDMAMPAMSIGTYDPETFFQH